MPELYNIDNPVLKISNEHKIITDYVSRFSKNRENPDPAFEKDLQSFLKFLTAALNGDPSYATSLMVLNLTREHGIFETRLKAIQAVEKRVDEEMRKTALMEKIGNFFDDLKDHARREIIELFPLIDANARCTALLKQYIQEVQSQDKSKG